MVWQYDIAPFFKYLPEKWLASNSLCSVCPIKYPRKFFCATCLLGFCTMPFIQAQHQYKLEMELSQAPSLGSGYALYAVYSDNSVTTLSSGGTANGVPFNRVEDLFFDLAQEVVRIRIYSTRANTPTSLQEVNDFRDFTNCYNYQDDPMNLANGTTIQYLRFNKLTSLSVLNNFGSTNNQVNDCENFTLNFYEPSCTGNSVISYAVEYAVNSGSWTQVLPYAARNAAATFSLSDFSGVQAGDNLRIRASYRASGASYSDILTYNVISCSPIIVSFQSQDTSCSYTPPIDGSFTVTFDRALNNGEQLTNLSLRWAGQDNILDTPDDVPVYDAIASTTYSGTAFTWPNGLDAGVYRLVYQSGGTNSVEEYDPITINNGPSMTFNSTWTDVNCFGENTGSISITVGGGTPPYEYLIPEISPNRVSFTGTSVLIPNLTAGTYTVRVYDSNNCTEQQ